MSALDVFFTYLMQFVQFLLTQLSIGPGQDSRQSQRTGQVHYQGQSEKWLDWAHTHTRISRASSVSKCCGALYC